MSFSGAVRVYRGKKLKGSLKYRTVRGPNLGMPFALLAAYDSYYIKIRVIKLKKHTKLRKLM